MKQRLVKITEILNAILASMETIRKTPSPQGAADRITVAAVIRELADRLDEIDNELNDVYEKNRSALKKINGEVNDLLQGLRPMACDEQDLRAVTFMNDPFSHLKDALRQLHDLLNRGETFYRQIQEAADQVSDIASDLSKLLGLVRSISANTHNKAINSIIAANRQGEKGGALKLLAQAMNELATKSDGFSGEVENIITSIISSAEEISRKETMTSAVPGEDDFSITRLERVMDDISGEYERFRENSLAAYERARELKKATDTTLSSLDFFKGLSQRINEYRDRLASLTARYGLEDILIAADVTDRGHVPGKHAVRQKDNIILFEEARRSIMGNGHDDGSVHEEPDSNVELF
jgi:methyl-accepting chemotaxis protein